MPYKWDAGYVENKDIIASRQYDNIINNFASTVNGGLDRENLPSDCISPTQIVADAVAIGNVSRLNYETETVTCPSPSYWTTFGWNQRGNFICGTTLENMQGGNANILAATFNVDCEEGMLSVMWKCHTWLNTHFEGPNDPGGGSTGNNFSFKGAYWIVKVDGNTVAQSRTLFGTWNNVKVETAIPISKGNHQIRIEYNFQNAKESDFNNYYKIPVFHWWGGTIFTLNRLR